MTAETNQWIMQNFVVGFCEQRKPWWARSAGTAGNMLNGPIPVERVRELMQKAYAVEHDVFVGAAEPFKAEGFKAIYLPALGTVAGIPSDDYAIHQYDETLVNRVVEHINGAGIASAGLLNGGRRAWVQLEHPDNECAAGLKFRPGLLAGSSLDGSLRTLWKKVLTAVVCDNTMSAALFEGGEQVSIKHTKNSVASIRNGAASEQLRTLAETMGYAIEAQSKRVVTDSQFQAFLEALVPVPNDDGRGKTIALNKRNDLWRLYRSDERVAPWAGTALGVLQCVNTWGNHFQTVRNASRAERNVDNVLSGKIDIMDRIAMETLNKVLVAA